MWTAQSLTDRLVQCVLVYHTCGILPLEIYSPSGRGCAHINSTASSALLRPAAHHSWQFWDPGALWSYYLLPPFLGLSHVPLATVRPSSASNFLGMWSLLTPHTNLSMRASSRNAPNSQRMLRRRKSAAKSVIDSVVD